MKTTILFSFLLLLNITFSQTQIGDTFYGEEDFTELGYGTTISSDGSTIAIGSLTPPSVRGKVSIYKKESGSWVQVGTDINGFSSFGQEISLSSDGSIVAIGIPNGSTDDKIYVGGVSVYENVSGNWVKIGNTIVGEAAHDMSGRSISMSSDGSIVAIGAAANDGWSQYTRTGHVRVYKNEAGVWTQIGEDINGGLRDSSGASVSLSSDGSILAIGATGAGAFRDYPASPGNVKVYEKDETDTWVQIGETINFKGDNVSLSSDGLILAVGSSNIVRTYKNEFGVWTQIGSDIIGETGDNTGSSISLSSDGSVLAVGASNSNENGINSGQVRIYKYRGDNWYKIGESINGEAENDLFGNIDVSLSADGKTVIVPAVYADREVGGLTLQDAGYVKVFDLSETLSVSSNSVIDVGIFPNPSNGEFTIQLQDATQFREAVLYNALGKYIQTFTTTQVNINTVPNGLYILKVKTTIGESAKKIIVK